MWTINGTRIFVNSLNGSGKNIFARLQPLSGGTVIQRFGYESPIRKIGGLIVGDDDRDDIEALAASGSSFILAYDGDTYFQGYIADVSWTRTLTVYQNIRTDLDCEAPVYEVELTLYPS